MSDNSENEEVKTRAQSVRRTGSDQATSGKSMSFWIAIVLGIFLLGSMFMNMILFAFLVGSAGSSKSSFGESKYKEQTIQGEGKKKILVLPVEGVISDQKQDGLLSKNSSMVDQIRNQLQSARKDEKIKAILLKVDSPGGGVTASDRIWNLLRSFKKDRPEVPVVALMEGTAASGGYYVSAPADEIIAHPTTITGSIGVIMQLLVIHDLLEKKLGVSPHIITPDNADMKKMGSPLKKMTEKEENLFKKLITEAYDRFIEIVNKGRKQLSKDEVKELADGRIYTGKQAKENKLVDQIGYFQDAVDRAKEKAGLDRAKVVQFQKQVGIMELLVGFAHGLNSRKTALEAQLQSLLKGPNPPNMLYLWSGYGSARKSVK